MKRALVAAIGFILFVGMAAWAGATLLTGSSEVDSPGTGALAAASEDDFFLEVLSPADEVVVDTGTVPVEGRTVIDSFVTVNGSPVEVGTDGRFATDVPVPLGPSVIEVIASDFTGSGRSLLITVVRTG